MVPPFTSSELGSVVAFSQRKYSGNTFTSNATEDESDLLRSVNKKLRNWAEFIADRYNTTHGPFEIGFPMGNPVQYNSPRIKIPWAGVFKGNSNKQYATQISIVTNPMRPCIDVGFYFGAMAAHDLSKPERVAQEAKLHQLGHHLANQISSDQTMNNRYRALFQFEFLPYVKEKVVTEDEWLSTISTSIAGCQIKASVFPDQSDEVSFPTIDSYISQLMFLMSGIQSPVAPIASVPPLTPEQWAKQAERRAIIGYRGEQYIMEVEAKKLSSDKNISMKYPRHVALESSHYGYDILSFDLVTNQEIYIEVKTTAQIRKVGTNDVFYMSTNEYQQYLKNKNSYKLYRVYNIELEPSYVEINIDTLTPVPDGYVFRIS